MLAEACRAWSVRLDPEGWTGSACMGPSQAFDVLTAIVAVLVVQ